MTLKQKQALLAYLGYYEGELDGIWGTKSKKAEGCFLRDFGLPASAPEDDIGKALRHAVAYGMPELEADQSVEMEHTGEDWWKDIRYFTRDEFRCQCKGKYCNGFPVEPQEKMVRTVDEIRRLLGVPVRIVDAGGSGVRCPQHNANVGGVYNSLHLTGNAADLHSSKSPQEMARVAEEVMGATGEIGIYSWGIHVGIGKYSRFSG